jgi:hypothetical protein
LRSSERDRFPERVPELAAELAALDVDVLFVATSPEALAAREAVKRTKKTIPIVLPPLADPVGAGLVASPRATRCQHHRACAERSELEAKRWRCSLRRFRGSPGLPIFTMAPPFILPP